MFLEDILGMLKHIFFVDQHPKSHLQCVKEAFKTDLSIMILFYKFRLICYLLLKPITKKNKAILGNTVVDIGYEGRYLGSHFSPSPNLFVHFVLVIVLI